jgi:ribokinase
VSVLVAGALHWDVVVEAPHLPALDETVAGAGVAYRFGGKGGNQAVAAARFGARVAMAGCVGSDEAGAEILRALDAAGVDRAAVRRLQGASGMSVAIMEPGGGYGAVIVSGVNLQLDGAALPRAEDARVLLLQSEVPEAANLMAARGAGGARVVLNAAPARPVAPELLALLDLLVVNRVEAAAMAGDLPPEAAAEALRAQGPAAVIVTLGGEGLAGATAEGTFRLSAPRVKVASTHGAGDAFIGALAAELDRGVPLRDACGFAQQAAALVVATPPEARGALDRAAVTRFAAAQPSMR